MKNWETLILNGEVKTEAASLEEATSRKKKGHASPAIIAVFDRLKLQGVEDPLKYSFADENTAHNFCYACRFHANGRGLKDKVFVGRSAATVYLYNVEVW